MNLRPTISLGFIADTVSWSYAIAVLAMAFWFGMALDFTEAAAIGALFLVMRQLARMIRQREHRPAARPVFMARDGSAPRRR